MYDKHNEVKEEAYKMLRKFVGVNMSPELIKDLIAVRDDINMRYKGEYYVWFETVGEPVTHFTVDVSVHTVH